MKKGSIFRFIIFLVLTALVGCNGRDEVVSSQSLSVNDDRAARNTNANQLITEQNTEITKSTSIKTTPIWQGQVGKFSVNWTKSDISFSPSSSPKLKYTLSSIFEKRFNEGFAEVKKETPDSSSGARWRQSTSLSIKSIVGTIVSVEISHVYGVINTSHDLAYITFDLEAFNQSKLENLFAGYLDKSENNSYLSASAKLSNYFIEDEIFDALVKNFSQDGKKIKLDRKTFLTMINYNSNKSPETSVAIKTDKDGNDLFLMADSFRSFVFDKMEDQKVVVRIQVYENTGKPYELHWIEVKLPVSSDLKPRLEEAENLQNAFLLSNSEIKFKDFETVLTYEKTIK